MINSADYDYDIINSDTSWLTGTSSSICVITLDNDRGRS